MFNEATFVSFTHPGCFGVNTEQCSDRSDDHTTVVRFFSFCFFKQRRTTLCRSSLTTAKHQGCLNCSGQACHNGGTLTA